MSAHNYRATLCVGNDNLNHAPIVRRSASHAVLDAPRPLLRQSVTYCIPTCVRNNKCALRPAPVNAPDAETAYAVRTGRARR
ncbi:hypothetical protein E2N90_02290 [Pseudomonas syringae pv. tomato]|nr:hypothetical protein EIZ61_06115 [Pseudomonas syringae]TES57264.1 hypothetical protein E2N91_18255 [Pseudomonas syringae pv. tomato]TES70018.1 hypothetical protein E2N90_02290 [Pseudomonas syringae pv. tomato]TES78602.1 hypothetical protein E2N89_11305 [Pseudomonas syringae pv. tomato]